MVDFISVNILADVLGTSRSNVSKWAVKNKIDTITRNGIEGFSYSQLVGIPQIDEMLNSKWDDEWRLP